MSDTQLVNAEILKQTPIKKQNHKINAWMGSLHDLHKEATTDEQRE